MSDRIEQFRQLVFGGIRRALEIEDYSKMVEGAITVHYPQYFGSDDYVVEMYCYVLGPSRNYKWTGATLDAALDAAAADVKEWIAELEEGE